MKANLMCPHCSIPLTVIDKQGIEIDFCEKCHGVWLDKDELDKLIERTDSSGAKNTAQNAADIASTVSDTPLADIFDFLGGMDI
jgi:Zn-finger nucleic acid-binding protein